MGTPVLDYGVPYSVDLGRRMTRYAGAGTRQWSVAEVRTMLALRVQYEVSRTGRTALYSTRTVSTTRVLALCSTVVWYSAVSLWTPINHQPTMPRSQRGSIMAQKDLIPQKRAQVIEAYRTVYRGIYA